MVTLHGRFVPLGLGNISLEPRSFYGNMFSKTGISASHHNEAWFSDASQGLWRPLTPYRSDKLIYIYIYMSFSQNWSSLINSQFNWFTDWYPSDTPMFVYVDVIPQWTPIFVDLCGCTPKYPDNSKTSKRHDVTCDVTCPSRTFTKTRLSNVFWTWPLTLDVHFLLRGGSRIW